MNDYISRDAAVCVADYAADEHPYDKDPAKPETFSEYNQGWHDACDYIRDRLENAEKADVAPVRRGRWEWRNTNQYTQILTCTACGKTENAAETSKYCPNCGARMDGGTENA